MAELALTGVGLAAGLAQTLFSALQTKEVKELCTRFRCRSQLKKLQDTMSTIKNVLCDVESKRQGLTHEGQVWVEKLKDAVYDFDDLLDEVNTIAQRNKQDAKLSKKVGRFFSRNNEYLVSFNVSREINLLREKLEAIAKNHVDFGLTANVTKPVKLREETCSVISELEVIGREDDIKTIVNMLLSGQDHSSDKNVSYVSIVGVGGLGKTTLAQLVYNDERVKKAFSERIWVCVAEEFGIKEILGKMLGENKDITLEKLQKEARALLEKKKYLLILDDVWNENHVEWRNLKSVLVSDVSGSKVIVTTRSKKVASSIGEDSTIYELNGLSEENSWSLFKRIAFGKREDQINTDLVEIGEDIAKKCGNVPLSIRVTASLLYDLDKSKWKLFRDSELGNLWRSNEDDSVMSTLMFSYYNLSSSELKSCFSFCSLFPKDYHLEKKVLINLWLAQGFLVATHDHESMEDVGERYFTILLNRCFFQDIKLDDHGEVKSCKMHDLMHDLALEVAGKESSIITPANENHLRNEIRHISIYDSRLKSNLCIGNAWRTFIFSLSLLSSVDINALLSKGGIRLRVLHLSSLVYVTLPNSIGKLLHLRYLDLSSNHELEMLPKSITKLHNLQILKLAWCSNLKELPEKTSKLVNLRTLDIDDCESFTHMPRGMYNLKNLHTLPEFVVGGVDSKQVQGSKLVDLQALTSLKGDLLIKIRDFSSNNIPHYAIERAFKLRGARELEIRCGSSFCNKNYYAFEQAYYCIVDQSEVHETLVEQVCPNDDIGSIKIFGYEGMKMPSWASMLVNVKVSSINGLQQEVTSSLSQLCHLKVLKLESLRNVEYIESEAAWELVSRPNNNESKIVVFFPALEKLVLKEMPKLKGWWREVRWEEMDGCLADDGNANGNGGIQEHATVTLPYFPHLRELGINRCESMMYFPPCPYLKKLHLWKVNEALTFCNKNGSIVASGVTSISRPFSSDSTSSSSDVLWFLENLKISYERVMNSVSKEFVGGVVDMFLYCQGNKKEGMRLVKEGFEMCGSSLQHLVIENCGKLRKIGIEQLSNLQSLRIEDYDEVDEEDNESEEEEEMPWKKLSLLMMDYDEVDEEDNESEEEDNESEEEEGMPWKNLQSLSSLTLSVYKEMPKGLRYLGTSLQSLEISHCDKMEKLGETIGFLTSLQSLHIGYCSKLKALPESLKFLTSLQSLHIEGCSKLKALPESLKFLTSLRLLCIYRCDEVKSLPEAMCHLTSLNTLDISFRPSDELHQRCQKPNGEDWPKICHIPNIVTRKTRWW